MRRRSCRCDLVVPIEFDGEFWFVTPAVVVVVNLARPFFFVNQESSEDVLLSWYYLAPEKSKWSSLKTRQKNAFRKYPYLK